ncbi:MAG: ferritin [Anaerolineae bacterium]|nr:ferritin [Anaerolineae bacterium]
MQISTKIETAFNEQIREELESAYIYLSMAAYLEAENLPGMAHWMRAQSQEEVEHAMKFFEHINERGGRVQLKALSAPPIDFGGPTDVFQKALEHEQHITRCIHDLYRLSIEEKDYASLSMLQWFVDEQVEEEDNVGQVVEMFKLAGEKGQALFMIDRQLAQR